MSHLLTRIVDLRSSSPFLCYSAFSISLAELPTVNENPQTLITEPSRAPHIAWAHCKTQNTGQNTILVELARADPTKVRHAACPDWPCFVIATLRRPVSVVRIFPGH